ncbi:Rieske (2Fe-2S) protein [Nodosilinea sp. FACHB-13]|uniref:Rieske (2Fe-2S) protein n=1 Tax=Cyanophyceae TaxID=3028117 RepID=UPI001687D07F|nr:Rieske (2Fe-2S) protein [Nodosilinea sp. FACHB-13]MBD2106716.1 Rieske 2Fe-2S domain-containing protein [Nodosilinea sp. FACHB-13]
MTKKKRTRSDFVLCAVAWAEGRRPHWLPKGEPLPLAGDPHADSGIPNASAPHWHISWPHVSSEALRAAPPEKQATLIITKDRVTKTEVRYLPRLRPPIPWLLDSPNTAGWWYEWAAGFEGAKLDCDRCPHQAYSLKDVPPDEHGRRQCPMHGLTFGADGEVVKLEPPAISATPAPPTPGEIAEEKALGIFCSVVELAAQLKRLEGMSASTGLNVTMPDSLNKLLQTAADVAERHERQNRKV